VRVARLFRKLAGLTSCVVEKVDLVEATEDQPMHLVLQVRTRSGRDRCGRCGRKARGRHGKGKMRTWRDLSPWGIPMALRGEVRRVVCGTCGVRTMQVPWARTGSRFTRRFEDEVAWFLQRADQTTTSQYFGIAWESAGRIARRVVEEKLAGRGHAAAFLGVDEISYGRPRKFLTVIVDHETGQVVWAAQGKNAETLRGYFESLTPEERDAVEVVTMDMSAAFKKAVAESVPKAVIVYDRFHVMQLLSRAVDDVRRSEMRACFDPAMKAHLKGTRWALLKNEWNLTLRERQKLAALSGINRRLYRARLLRDAFQVIFQARTVEEADLRWNEWLQWARRSRLKPFLKLAHTVGEHWEGIRRFIELRITNAPVEGYNSKIRMISHRAFGFHHAASLIAMIKLNCAGITLSPIGHDKLALAA
jgi:transposase